MAGIVKHTLRFGVIATIVGGGVVLAAQSPRARALVAQAKTTVAGAVDGAIDDPVALRVKMERMQAEYPKRIDAVRSDLIEVRDQVAQLERELSVARRVVALADQDLEDLDQLLAMADQSRAQQGGIVKVRYQDKVMSPGEASANAANIARTRDAYEQQSQSLENDLGYLRQQEQRLLDVLATLESEYDQFQAQLWQLDRKVEAAARNDRLIAMMEKRHSRIAEYERYEATSLDGLHRRIDGIRAAQEAKLERLAGTASERDYESRARRQIDREGRVEIDLRERAADPVALPERVIDLDEKKEVVRPLAAGRGG